MLVPPKLKASTGVGALDVLHACAAFGLSSVWLLPLGPAASLALRWGERIAEILQCSLYPKRPGLPVPSKRGGFTRFSKKRGGLPVLLRRDVCLLVQVV